jgi:hypothetical protein
LNPFAICNIINRILDFENYEKNVILENIIFNALDSLMKLIELNPKQIDKKHKFYSLLSNAFISDDVGVEKFKTAIIPRLFELKKSKLINNGES